MKPLPFACAVVLAASISAAELPAQASGREPADLLITRGTVVTMDSVRRVLEDGAVAIIGSRIVAVGTTAELTARYHARETIDAHRKIVMPGLIDGHGHAGHTMVKTLGTDIERWYEATEKIYARGSTVDFWRADGQLAALEKLRFGVTTSLVLFGGGDNVHRTDHERYGDAYLEAVQRVGLRWFLAVGPRRGPFPKTFTNWEGERAQDVAVSFEQQMQVSEALIRRWHGAADGRINLAVVFPTQNPATNPLTGENLVEVQAQARAARALSRRHRVLFVQDGHTRGTVQFAHDQLDLLGPDAIFSHATELTPEEIELVARTGTKIAHNPSANFSIRGRNPTTELLEAGATVMLGSDGVAPDRSYDMFRHGFQAMRYHRFHFRDTNVLPAGKVLEMMTIDAARALGIDADVGSLEPGKKADIILVDWFRPHMVPMNMPLYRLAYFANGNDVSTVLVDGRVLMRDRQVLSVNEEEALLFAEREANAAIRRMGLQELMETPEGFWGGSRLRRP